MFTFFNGCGIPPVTVTCPGNIPTMTTTVQPTHVNCGGAQAQTVVGPTAFYGCPTVTGTVLGPTAYLGCHNGGAQAQTILGPTAYLGCHQGGANAQTMPPPSAICATAIACVPPAQPQGVGTANTLATVCTQPAACGPTHLLGCTGYEGCQTPQGTTFATVCTRYGCDAGAGAGAGSPAAGAQVPSIPVADCIPTRHCTGVWPVC